MRQTVATFISLPIFLFLAILQSSLINRFYILRGTTDLILVVLIAWTLQKRVKGIWQWCIIGALVFSIFSALPIWATLIGYMSAVGITLLLRRRVWQYPILAMIIATFIGTVISHLVALVSLRLVGNPIPWLQALNLITVPSLLLNLLIAFPAYALLGDLASWLYPEEIVV
jgi:hypothetical protein